MHTEKKTILLIEDQNTVREMMSEFLDFLGYTPVPACNPDSAEKMARAHAGRINAIICDVVLGRLYGPDVIRELRQWIPDAAVVYTSGYPSQDLTKNGAEQFRYFLPKPFSVESMQDILERALSGS
jgi:DNA-binding NtrC family response regulator